MLLVPPPPATTWLYHDNYLLLTPPLFASCNGLRLSPILPLSASERVVGYLHLLPALKSPPSPTLRIRPADSPPAIDPPASLGHYCRRQRTFLHATPLIILRVTRKSSSEELFESPVRHLYIRVARKQEEHGRKAERTPQQLSLVRERSQPDSVRMGRQWVHQADSARIPMRTS